MKDLVEVVPHYNTGNDQDSQNISYDPTDYMHMNHYQLKKAWILNSEKIIDFKKYF